MKTWIIAAALGAATSLSAQPTAARVATAADRTLLTELIATEDSRRPMTAADVRGRGLSSGNPYIRAFTVRGLGRLEQPAAFNFVLPLLSDSSAEVRVAAADALAQSVARPLVQNAPEPARSQNATSIALVRRALVEHLAKERHPQVRAMTLESIGRLSQGSADQVKATADLLAPSLSATDPIERRGAIRGLFFLARKREARAAGAIPTIVTDKLYAMLDEASAGFTPTDRANIAFTLSGAVALDDTRTRRLLEDRETFVRERGVVNLARSNDLAFIREQLLKTSGAAEPVLRFRTITVYAQKLRASMGCGPLLHLSRDSNVTVALAAIDALSGCRDDPAVTSHLRTIAQTFSDNGDQWHRPAHAFVALSTLDSVSAGSLLPRFMGSSNFFVRMYADTAARLMRNVPALEILSRDPHPNVQASAISALSRLVGHTGDSIYLRALSSDDNQVLMAATAALQGSTLPGIRDKARQRWGERRGRGWDTDVDGQTALAELSGMVEPHLTAMAPVPRVPLPLPSFENLAELETATARIEMMDGGVVTMRLHPFDAPTNAFRFARLARAKVFDGMTFHRVAPFFVVQGPGPNANEYSAPDKPFARDELGLSNVRGSVGLSTRGRDTGDGQIYVNTVDNIWLDHDYTVMGTITSGIEVFDRMQEGARIRRITITP
jgi:cyclophilin family peptidyl-prolyl cis-trans isomerase/HEAT repeat protein